MKLMRWVEDHLSGRWKKRSGSGERKSTSSSKSRTSDMATSSSSLLHYPSTQLQMLHRHQQQLQNQDPNGHHHHHHHPVYLRQQDQLENILIPSRRHHTECRPHHHRMPGTSMIRPSSSGINQTASFMPWNRSSSHSYSSHAMSTDQRSFLMTHDPQSHDAYEKEEYLTVFLPSGSSSPSSSGSSGDGDGGGGNDNDHRITDHAISVVHHEDPQDGQTFGSSISHLRNTRRINGIAGRSMISMTTTRKSAAAEPSPRTRDRSRIQTNPWLRSSSRSTPRQSSYSDSSSSGSSSHHSTDSGCSTTGLNDSALILNQRQDLSSGLNAIGNGKTFTRPASYRLSINANNNNNNSTTRARNLSRNTSSSTTGVSQQCRSSGGGNSSNNNRGASSNSLMTCQSMSISSVTSGSGNSACSVTKDSSSLSCPSNRSSIYTNDNMDEHFYCRSRESIASSSSSSAAVLCLPPPPDHSYSQLMLEDLLSNLISSRNERLRESDAASSELTANCTARSSRCRSSSGGEDHHPFYRHHRQRRDADDERIDGEDGVGTTTESQQQQAPCLGTNDNDAGGDDEDEEDDEEEDGSREDSSPSSSSCHSSGLSSAGEIVWTERKVITSTLSPSCLMDQRQQKQDKGINKCMKSGSEKKQEGEGMKSIGKEITAIRRKTWMTVRGMRDVTPSRATNGQRTGSSSSSSPSPLSSPQQPTIMITASSNRSSLPPSFCEARNPIGEGSGITTATDPALSRPTSFCSVLSRGGKDSTPSSISSSCTSGRGLSCSSSSIPAGRRFPYSSLVNKRRFSLIPSSSFCQQRGPGPGTRIMNEEWVSAATELLYGSDEEEDVDDDEEGMRQDSAGSGAVNPSHPSVIRRPGDMRDGAGHRDPQSSDKVEGVDEEQGDEAIRNKEQLRSELEDFVTNVFREEMERLNQH